MNDDYGRKEMGPMKQAFSDWKEAANEWIIYYGQLEHKERLLTIGEQRRLHNLELWRNSAAKRYKIAIQSTN